MATMGPRFIRIWQRTVIVCRRKRSGRRLREAAWRGTVFRGATSFRKARPTTTETPPFTAMTWDRMAIMRLGVSEERVRRRVRLGRLRRMVTDSTTWLAIYLSGAGIGMEHRMVNRLRI